MYLYSQWIGFVLQNQSEDAKEKFQEIGYAYKYLTEGILKNLLWILISSSPQVQDLWSATFLRLKDSQWYIHFAITLGITLTSAKQSMLMICIDYVTD
jgi:hypothetical protein